MQQSIFASIKRKTFFLALVNSILLLSLGTSATTKDNALTEMKMAQEAYLQENGSQTLKHIKNALISSQNHPMVIKNMNALYAHGLAKGLFSGNNVDWKVPSELQYLNVSVNRKYMYEGGNIRFFMSAGAVQSEAGVVEEFQVIRYPNKIIIDKAAGIGKWDDQIWDGQPAFWVSENWHANQVEEGLYLINIKVKNKSMVQGWFIIENENSSASPVIKTPSVNQVFKTDRPTIHWKNFQSPEYSSLERNKLSLKISKEADNHYEEIVNAEFLYNPQAKDLSFQVGDRTSSKNYIGANRLAPGLYQLTVGYRELHNFGDLFIARVSSSKVPFTINTDATNH